MLIGYARVSTVEQDAGFEAQERDLKAAGAERLFSERTSAVGPRKALEQALDFAREGDAMGMSLRGETGLLPAIARASPIERTRCKGDMTRARRAVPWPLSGRACRAHSS